MREGARRAVIASGGVALVAAAAWASRDLPDPIGEAVEAACEATIPRGGRAVEIVSLDHVRAPLAPEEWGPSGPAGDTLHEVEIAYAWRGPGEAEGRDAIRCAYVDDAAGAGFERERLSVETADAAPRP